MCARTHALKHTHAIRASLSRNFHVKHSPTKHTGRVKFQGMHHVGLLCENLELSLTFYKDLLGRYSSQD